jgi:hypothetical protein
MTEFVSGATMMGLFVIAMFFVRYFRHSGDRLFLLFAIAFGILSANRILLGLTDPTAEMRPLLYVARLSAFVLILAGIVDKIRYGRT